MLNLAVNARDAMPAGGSLILQTRNGWLDASPDRPAGEFIRLTVSDTGEGMKAEVLARVFEPFFTTKEQGKGTGLGLAQVHGFVKQSGGDITVESRPGTGTTITLYLPRAAGDLVASNEVSVSSTPALSGEAAGGRVLVVEDNPDVAAFACTLLGEIGFWTMRTATAHEALSVLEQGSRIDVIFSDVLMPGTMSGVDLAHVVRRLYPHIALVLTTGYSPAMVKGLDLPGVDVLMKPYKADDLARALRRALDLKR